MLFLIIVVALIAYVISVVRLVLEQSGHKKLLIAIAATHFAFLLPIVGSSTDSQMRSVLAALISLAAVFAYSHVMKRFWPPSLQGFSLSAIGARFLFLLALLFGAGVITLLILNGRIESAPLLVTAALLPMFLEAVTTTGISVTVPAGTDMSVAASPSILFVFSALATVFALVFATTRSKVASK